MTKRFATISAVAVLLGISSMAEAQTVPALKAKLQGLQAVPAISSTGSGEFRARVANDDSAIEYEMSYANLEGSILQAHIHFGQPSVNGAIVVFFCTNLGNGPAGTQVCPESPATITGTILAADVVSIAAAQGIGAGELDEVLAAIRNRVAYVDVHTDTYPGCEIRGAIDPGKDTAKK